MKVVIHFFRHGESEANVVQHQQKLGTIKHLLMLDPALTEKGVQASINSQQSAPYVDVVLASELVRAIQTALYTYPSRFVSIVPFLNELGTGLDNVPMCKNIQKQTLGEDYYRLIYKEHTHEHSFLEYISKNIVPLHADKDVLRIALFTHSRLMKNHLSLSLSS